MRSLLICALGALFLALPLAAEFEAEVNGGVREHRESISGAEIAVKPDPYWGKRNLEGLEKFMLEHGELPEVSITGTGTSDEQGQFKFKVKITLSGEGEPPSREFKDREGNTIRYHYVPCILTARKDGYLPASRHTDLSKRSSGHAHFDLKKRAILKGKVVHITGRKPVANLPMFLQRWEGKSAEDRLDFTTDSDGCFEIYCDDWTSSGTRLETAGHDLAFASSSKAWRGVVVSHGTEDLGTLVVVPGGSFRARAVNLDTSARLRDVTGELKTLDKPREVRFAFWSNEAGEIRLEGVPTGRYSVSVRSEGYWSHSLEEIEVATGKVVDIGSVALAPHRHVEIIAPGAERYNVTATFLGDELPAELGRYSRQYTVRNSLTAENNRLDRLVDGEWLFRVTAQGYSEFAEVITVDGNRSVDVEWTAAAAIQFEAVDGEGRDLRCSWCYAVRHGTAAHELVRALSADRLEDHFRSLDPLPVGVYRHDRQSQSVKALPPGTYLLLAKDSWLVVRADDLDVGAGESVDATLTPIPGRVEVRVLESGKPVPDFPVNFLMQHLDEESEVVSATTDARGVAVSNWQVIGKVFVLTEPETAWVTIQDPERRVLSDKIFPGRSVDVRPGQNFTAKLELANPEQVLVRFRVKLPERQRVLRMGMTRTDGTSGYRQFNVIESGEENLAVCVPQGTYRVFMHVQGIGGRTGTHESEVVVDGLKEQAFELRPVLPKLELTINAPGIDGEDLRLNFGAQGRERMPWDDEEHWQLPSLDGPTVIDCLSLKRYVVRVQALDDVGEVRLAARRTVDIAGDTSLEILLTDDVGSLEVELVDPPVGFAAYRRVPVTVYFKDAAGELVFPGDSTLASRHSRKFSIPSVPTGTYTVIVTAADCQPFETPDVVIRKGESTALKATPEQAGTLVVTVKDIRLDFDSNIEWVMEDADGEPVELLLPDGSVATARFQGQGGTVLELLNLTPDVKQVRIKIEGYTDIVVKTDVKAGETIKADAIAEAEEE